MLDTRNTASRKVWDDMYCIDVKPFICQYEFEPTFNQSETHIADGEDVPDRYTVSGDSGKEKHVDENGLIF